MAEVVEQAKASGRLREFLNQLIAIENELSRSKDSSQSEIKIVAEALIKLGEEVEDAYDIAGVMGLDLRISLIIQRYLWDIDAETRCEWLQNQIVHGTSVSTIVTQIHIEDDKKIEEDFLFSKQCREDLRKAWLRRLVDLARSHDLSRTKDLGYILQKWVEWAPDQGKERNEFVSHLAESVEGVGTLLKGFVKTKRIIDVITEHPTSIILSFDLHGLRQFIDPKILLQLIKSESSSNKLGSLTETSREAIDLFLKAMEETSYSTEGSISMPDDVALG